MRMSIERAEMMESREALIKEVREDQRYFRSLKDKLKKHDMNVLFCSTHHDKGSKKRIVVIKKPDGYCVMANSDIISENRSLAECTKQAYVKGYLGYYQHIRLAYGKNAEERARKDPATQTRLKKAGEAANAY